MIVFERFYLVMGRFFSGFLRNFFYNTFEMSSTRNLTYNYRPAASLNICEQKEKFRQIIIEEKRKLYKCGDDFVIMKDIDSWSVTATSGSMPSIDIKGTEGIYKHNSILNDKISIYEGDITRLEIDSIVNAANSSLLGGGGVDGVIHRAAGPFLYEECKTLNGCKTGEAKITCGYMLPAKHVIHTVGPRGEKPSELESCYTSCLNLAVENELRTIAFPCISTGVYGYPNEPAADVALQTVRTFLEANYQDIDKIIFCLFMKVDVSIYKKFLHRYFPIN